MILIHGTYRLFPTLVAYREGQCNHCERVTHADRFKAWYFLHLYWIPVLPLGRHAFWSCAGCRKDPRERVKESVTMLVLGIVAFSVFFLALMIPPIPEKDAGAIWVGRGVLLALIAYCVHQVRARRRAPVEVPVKHAYANDDCHHCGDRLCLFERQMFCLKCKIFRLDA